MKLRRWLALLLAVAAAASVAAATPWWTRLGDPQLDTLMQVAAPSGADAEQQLVQQYIALRVDHLRVQLVDGVIAAARNEQALWMSAPVDAQRDGALSAVGQRLAAAEQAADALRAQRQRRYDALRAASTIGDAQLQSLLAPALAEPTLPAPVLPPQIVNARVPQPLAALGEQARRVAQGRQWVEARRAEWQAREARLQLGSDDAVGTLQAYQQYAVDADRLAVDSGRLAVAYVAWLQQSDAAMLASRR